MEQKYPAINTDPNRSPFAEEPKISGPGLASFIISLVTGVLVCLTLVMMGFAESEAINGGLVSVVFIGLFALECVGIGLGLAGLFDKTRRRIFAVLGLAVAFITIMGFVLVYLLGSALG